MITINLTTTQWYHLQDKIYADVPLAQRVFRDRHIKALGFSVREHQGYGIRPKNLPPPPPQAYLGVRDPANPTKEYLHYIALDFVDEAAATLFRLRYL